MSPKPLSIYSSEPYFLDSLYLEALGMADDIERSLIEDILV
jgi:hypothetical protein